MTFDTAGKAALDIAKGTMVMSGSLSDTIWSTVVANQSGTDFNGTFHAVCIGA